MNTTTAALTTLFDRIPRRHSVENVKEINGIANEYEDLLMAIEATNSFYEKSIPPYFDELETARALIKKSTDNKASKKMKDEFFDEASGTMKDSIEKLISLYGDGTKTA
jgi:hypothetical protein